MKTATSRRSLPALSLAFAASVLAALVPAASAAPAARATPERATAQEKAQELTARAVEAFNRGRLDEAENGLNRSLGVAENVYETHFWLGRVFATRAGSSPVAKLRAVEEFRRALELQPYGEDGELARGWLMRIGGRPRTVVFSAAESPLLPRTEGGATRRVIEALQTSARTAGFEVGEAPEREPDLGTAKIEELSRLCEDGGALRTGWMVFVGVGRFEVERPEKSELYRATGDARMWIFDPLARHLYPPIAVSASPNSLLMLLLGGSKDREQSVQSGLGTLSSAIWTKCRRTIALNADPAVLDETTFPLRAEGVYGRAAVPYETALRLPLVAFSPCIATGNGTGDSAMGDSITLNDDEATDAARTLSVQLQQALMRTNRAAVVSPGNLGLALKSLGLSPASTAGSELAAAGGATGSRYVVVPALTAFEVKTKNYFLGTKVTVRADLRLTVWDGRTGQAALTKTLTHTASVNKLLAGDAVKIVIAKQSEALSALTAAATTELLALLAPPPASLPAPPGSTAPPRTTPPTPPAPSAPPAGWPVPPSRTDPNAPTEPYFE